MRERLWVIAGILVGLWAGRTELPGGTIVILSVFLGAYLAIELGRRPRRDDLGAEALARKDRAEALVRSAADIAASRGISSREALDLLIHVRDLTPAMVEEIRFSFQEDQKPDGESLGTHLITLNGTLQPVYHVAPGPSCAPLFSRELVHDPESGEIRERTTKETDR